MTSGYQHFFKLLMLGGNYIGKTCLFHRLRDKDVHIADYPATIGVVFAAVPVECEGEKVDLQIWDTAGAEVLTPMTRMYLRGSKAIIVIYDVTNEDSFDKAKRWLEEIHDYCEENQVVKVLVGNKVDQKKTDDTLTEEVRKFADEIGIEWFETSARKNINVEEMILAVTKMVLRTKKEGRLCRNLMPVLFGNPGDCQVRSCEQLCEEKPYTVFNSQDCSDTVFIVGPKKSNDCVKIFGHQRKLASFSPVFAAMFNPDKSGLIVNFDKEGKLEVEVDDPDTHPTALLSLFRFMYKEEVVVDRQLIHETLYIGEKYDVTNFVKSLKSLLDLDSVLGFYPFVAMIGDRHILYEKCNRIILSNIQVIINSDPFLELDDAFMSSFLSNYALKAGDINIRKAYFRWADHQCLKNNLSVNDENRRKVMTHLHLIPSSPPWKSVANAFKQLFF